MDVKKYIRELLGIKKYSGFKFNIRQPILDIGGGSGIFLEKLGIEKADIVDLTDKQNKKYNYIKADITKKFPKLPHKKYKTIFIMETLEHIRNPIYLMAQVYDILDDEGICYVAVPYTKLAGTGIGSHPGHVNNWTLREIKNQVDKLGFHSKVLKKRRRFLNTAFFLPHCWIVLALKKRMDNRGTDYSR
jgi:predicted SAM-dependent methyltransferase